MAFKIDGGKILSTIISELVKILLPWTVDTLEQIVKNAYQWVEDWADHLDEKPTSTGKMEVAVAMVRASEPEIDPAEARLALEAHHIAEEGKGKE